MIRAFAQWWMQQMAALLPHAWRGGAAADALVLRAGPDGLALLRRRHGQERSLGRLAPDADAAALARLLPRRRPARLVLRTDAVLLERDVTLPLVAEPALARVLHYEMDRLTPFHGDDLFWDFAPLRRDPAQGRLYLRLWLLPRAALQPLLESLARRHLVPDLLEAAAPGGAMRAIRLHRPAPRQRAALRLAAALCGSLALLAAALPFLAQSLAAARVEARIAALRRPLAAAEALRRQESAGTDVLAAERARLGDALAALAAVTAALPDDSFLTEFALRQRQLRLGGQSRAAAALIPRLAADRQFRNPAFAAPVTRSDTGGADLFTITAELAR